MKNPINAMADDATRWADEVFEAVRLNKPDDPDHPPIDIEPALMALAGFKPEDAATLAIGATDDADARGAIKAVTVACEAFASRAMSASMPGQLIEAHAGLSRAIKAMRRYAVTVTTTGKAEAEQATSEPQASPEVKRAAMLYKQATDADPALNTTPKVYRYLIETLEPEDGPTSEDAFKKAITRARKIGLLESKRAPRNISRATGKSVVRYDQL